MPVANLVKQCAIVQEGYLPRKLEFFGHDFMKECGVDNKKISW